MSLTTSQIDTIAKQVYRQFPEVQDTRPAVQTQPGAKALDATSDRFVLTFKGHGQGPGGKSIARIVRVIADERGKILKDQHFALKGAPMLNQCHPMPLQDELKLKYWQFILRLTRAAAHAKRWGAIFNQNRAIMALAFLAGILIGLIPVFK